MSFTQWVLLLKSENQSKHQDICCQFQRRHGKSSLWELKLRSWWNLNSEKSSFQGCFGDKWRRPRQGGIREGSTWQGVALTQVIWMLLIIRDDSLLFTLHQLLWKTSHLSALTHCFTRWVWGIVTTMTWKGLDIQNPDTSWEETTKNFGKSRQIRKCGKTLSTPSSSIKDTVWKPWR